MTALVAVERQTRFTNHVGSLYMRTGDVLVVTIHRAKSKYDVVRERKRCIYKMTFKRMVPFTSRFDGATQPLLVVGHYFSQLIDSFILTEQAESEHQRAEVDTLRSHHHTRLWSIAYPFCS